MKAFLLEEVCDILHIKPDLLRHWEMHMPIIHPRYNDSGIRLYSFQDIQKLFRLKYLIYMKMYSAEDAIHKLIQETHGASTKYQTAIQDMRKSVLRAILRVKSQSKNASFKE